MDALQIAIQKAIREMNEAIEREIVKFLDKEGYHLEDLSGESIAALEEQLAAEGKRLRVEVFTKMSGKLTASMVILPFFEPVDQVISRVEIYRMLSLSSQGYQI